MSSKTTNITQKFQVFVSVAVIWVLPDTIRLVTLIIRRHVDQKIEVNMYCIGINYPRVAKKRGVLKSHSAEQWRRIVGWPTRASPGKHIPQKVGDYCKSLRRSWKEHIAACVAIRC